MLVATSAGKLSPLGVLPLHVQGMQGLEGAQGLQGQTRHGAEAEGRGARQEAIAELLAELATRRSVRVFVLQGPNVAAPISMLNALQVCCVSICEHSHTQGEGERAREKERENACMLTCIHVRWLPRPACQIRHKCKCTMLVSVHTNICVRRLPSASLSTPNVLQELSRAAVTPPRSAPLPAAASGMVLTEDSQVDNDGNAEGGGGGGRRVVGLIEEILQGQRRGAADAGFDVADADLRKDQDDADLRKDQEPPPVQMTSCMDIHDVCVCVCVTPCVCARARV